MQTENVLKDSRLRALENHTRVNLLRPTLGTTTFNGVTYTNNGDGTYTLNGTATAQTGIRVSDDIKNSKGKKYKCIFAKNETAGLYLSLWYNDEVITVKTEAIIESYNHEYFAPLISINKDTTLNNVVIKPMLTTDLDATYDDFVSYEDSLQPGINTGLKMDSLWTNAIPSALFSAQVIDLSRYANLYKFFKLQYVTAFSYDGITEGATKELTIPTNDVINVILTCSYWWLGGRRLSFNKGVFSFGNGAYSSNYGTDFNINNNSQCAPYKIYGVK